jgi:hypothetical protein
MMDLRIDITEAEILADLTWPGPPPGHWPVRSGASPAYEKQEPGADQGRRANSSPSASSPRAVSASPSPG